MDAFVCADACLQACIFTCTSQSQGSPLMLCSLLLFETGYLTGLQFVNYVRLSSKLVPGSGHYHWYRLLFLAFVYSFSD